MNFKWSFRIDSKNEKNKTFIDFGIKLNIDSDSTTIQNAYRSIRFLRQRTYSLSFTVLTIQNYEAHTCSSVNQQCVAHIKFRFR